MDLLSGIIIIIIYGQNGKKRKEILRCKVEKIQMILGEKILGSRLTCTAPSWTLIGGLTRGGKIASYVCVNLFGANIFLLTFGFQVF